MEGEDDGRRRFIILGFVLGMSLEFSYLKFGKF